MLELQKDFNQALIQKFEQQQKYINELLDRRDKHFLEAFRETQQSRLETAVSSSKKGFFSRLFSKNN